MALLRTGLRTLYLLIGQKARGLKILGFYVKNQSFPRRQRGPRPVRRRVLLLINAAPPRSSQSVVILLMRKIMRTIPILRYYVSHGNEDVARPARATEDLTRTSRAVSVPGITCSEVNIASGEGSLA